MVSAFADDEDLSREQLQIIKAAKKLITEKTSLDLKTKKDDLVKGISEANVIVGEKLNDEKVVNVNDSSHVNNIEKTPMMS